MLFKKLYNARLTMNWSKSHFLESRIIFLGHIVTPEVIFVDPDKTKALNDFPALKNLKQLHSFPGYVRRFVPNLAFVGAPLYALFRERTKWIWAQEEEEGFHQLKKLFIQHTQLDHPLDDNELIVQTYSSNFG
jgi:hypothetical protein